MHSQPTLDLSSSVLLREMPEQESSVEDTARSCVLVAEDDQDDVFLLRRAFQKAGLLHQIINVPDGERTIEYLSGNPPYDDRVRYPFPQLLLLDLKMPKV